jgi:predicted glycosyltransferase
VKRGLKNIIRAEIYSIEQDILLDENPAGVRNELEEDRGL